ncbi:Homocysteine S-methyltransferase [Tilletiaria anomala UBC 951]|uniref:Homocysteine S-methyltransferase n=1 Tax=Tilletiaria anomala (strain ATCC 24038 / CBS 436.72 / UBC 951) TaxID=1037660 RepID=A0A066VZ26_TILAU|nr:Homocysteine S-methyltransferase [Tilletiaria anomala UBC 951]KDN44069.1 Homocysteine S-methyltransferase [Tilletiaria anomala UBC 951]
MAGKSKEGGADILEGLLNAERIGVMDGGFATHLEDALHLSTPSPLWSAALLDPTCEEAGWKGHDAVRATHRAFLDVGARLIESASYQASTQSFLKSKPPRTYTAAGAEELMRQSVTLAHEAIASHSSKQSVETATSKTPLLTLSLGPYGAMLEGGREYSGDYEGASADAVSLSKKLHTFQMNRLQAYAEVKDTWEKIDLIAFETLPRLDEVGEIGRALHDIDVELTSKGQQHRPPAYFSFVFPENANGEETNKPNNDNFLPLPPDMSAAAKRTGADPSQHRTVPALVECVKSLCGQGWPILGLGINCTKPHLIQGIVRDLTQAFAQQKTSSTFASKSGKPVLFLYPDGGLTWDGIARCWRSGAPMTADKATEVNKPHASSLSEEETWARDLFALTQEPGVLKNVCDSGGTSEAAFDAVWLGGCCKASTGHIASLSRLVYPSQG